MKSKRRSYDIKAIREYLFPKGTYFDFPTLFIVLALCLFGLIMVYSASSFVAKRDTGSSNYYLMKQLRNIGVGLFALIVASKLNYKLWKILAPYLYVFIGFIVLFTVFMGIASHGSARWLGVGSATFQPSEFAKVIVAMLVAQMCCNWYQNLYTVKGTIKVLAFPLVLAGLIAKENLSTGIVCAVIAIVIWFIATPHPWWLIPIMLMGLLAAIALTAMEDYRKARITAWRNPMSEEGYQVRQSLYAVGSGGFFGRGLGQSLQKNGFIPEAQNDMIFSIICEELGIIGAVGLLIVIAMLIMRLLFIANGAPDRFGALLVSGIMGHIAVQTLINIGVNVNLIPNTGVPLPFISYGGSSMIALLFEIGICLSVSRQIVPEGALRMMKRKQELEARQ